MKLCSAEGCGRVYLARGYCTTHYSRLRGGRAINTPIRYRSPAGLCVVEGCNHKHISRGWCYIHYQAWQRHGDPLGEAQYSYYSDAEKSKRSRTRKQGAMLWYKMQHPCEDCGCDDPRVLDFDHIRGAKEFQLKDAKSKPLVEILLEIQKCDVVCANCHRLRTQARMNGKGKSTTYAELGLGVL